MCPTKILTDKITPFESVYQIVQRIPKGKVLTYGAISKLMNGRLSAAAVGWALRALPSEVQSKNKRNDAQRFHSRNVPWHRVINSRGGLSTNNEPGIPSGLQQSLLESEGIKFDLDVTLDLQKYLWQPPPPRHGLRKPDT